MSEDVRSHPLHARSWRMSAFAAGALPVPRAALAVAGGGRPRSRVRRTTTLTLDLPNGVRAKGLGQVTVSGDTVTLANTSGNLDPISGAGNVKTTCSAT